MNSTTNLTSVPCDDTGNKAANEFFNHFSYWTEYVLQNIIGSVGIASNVIAIPVLCSRELRNIFNCLLLSLAVFDSFFILCQMLEARRKIINTNHLLGREYSEAHEYAFAYFLYQFHSYVLCCSMYITISLALERYRAVCKPVEYYNNTRGVNPWKKMGLGYLIPVMFFSLLFNVPKLFEIRLGVLIRPLYQNGTRTGSRNLTMAEPTDLRMNEAYVIAWVNVAKLIVHGIIPFASLSFFNHRIYRVIRRKQLTTCQSTKMRPTSGTQESTSMEQDTIKNKENSATQRKAFEKKQAFVLLSIVCMHLICHIPRFLINLHEFFSLDILRKGVAPLKYGKLNCESFPIWALAITSVSHCLLTLNSSSNLFIYCFTCSTFRDALCQWGSRFCQFFSCSCCHCTERFKSQNPKTELIGEEETGIPLKTIETDFTEIS